MLHDAERREGFGGEDEGGRDSSLRCYRDGGGGEAIVGRRQWYDDAPRLWMLDDVRVGWWWNAGLML